ncbi:MAG: hypothetical protein NZ518_02095 [Dehalococcoidia bacterium]|nr:hypothetical protein [Dehalococcoidia bacterium]
MTSSGSGGAPNLTAAAIAGAAGSLAYLIEQAADIALFKDPTDDVKLLGMVVTRRTPWWLLIGLPTHYVNGALLGMLYATVVEPRLPGPGWLKGLILAQVENYALWQILIRVVDRVHPAVREGKLPTYDRPTPFVQGVLRHVAYGVALGGVYALLTKRN